MKITIVKELITRLFFPYRHNTICDCTNEKLSFQIKKIYTETTKKHSDFFVKRQQDLKDGKGIGRLEETFKIDFEDKQIIIVTYHWDNNWGLDTHKHIAYRNIIPDTNVIICLHSISKGEQVCLIDKKYVFNPYCEKLIVKKITQSIVEAFRVIGNV